MVRSGFYQDLVIAGIRIPHHRSIGAGLHTGRIPAAQVTTPREDRRRHVLGFCIPLHDNHRLGWIEDAVPSEGTSELTAAAAPAVAWDDHDALYAHRQ